MGKSEFKYTKIAIGDRSLSDFMYALIITKSKLVNSFGVGIYEYNRKQNSRNMVDVVIEIESYNIKKFEELAKVVLKTSKEHQGVMSVNSQSPTEPMSVSELNDPANDDSSLTDFQHLEFDTLQEGDWFEGTEDQYRKVLELECIYDARHEEFLEGNILNMVDNNCCVFDGKELLWIANNITKLTPEEFLRRAENTFKK